MTADGGWRCEQEKYCDENLRGMTSIKRMNWFVGYLQTMFVNQCPLHQLLIANGSGWLKAHPGYRYTYTHMSVMSLLRDRIFFYWKSVYCLQQLNTSILNDAPFIFHWYNESGAGALTHLADGFKSAAPSPIGVSLEESVDKYSHP